MQTATGVPPSTEPTTAQTINSIATVLLETDSEIAPSVVTANENNTPPTGVRRAPCGLLGLLSADGGDLAAAAITPLAARCV